MRRILRTGICLLGLSATLAACGQNEGGRCQVTSDCGSGLVCKDFANGNGRCRSDTWMPDAATNADTSSDAPSSSLDLGLDTPSSSVVDLASVDSESVDASGID
jgi:predicted small lipoprotein YifL